MNQEGHLGREICDSGLARVGSFIRPPQSFKHMRVATVQSKYKKNIQMRYRERVKYQKLLIKKIWKKNWKKKVRLYFTPLGFFLKEIIADGRSCTLTPCHQYLLQKKTNFSSWASSAFARIFYSIYILKARFT